MAGIIYYDYSQKEPMRRASEILGVDEGALYSSPKFYCPTEEGVAGIREIIAALGGSETGERVVYFSHAEILNISCQNALLKTIEERDDVVVIFVSSKRLIETIESRCQIFRFNMPPYSEFERGFMLGGGKAADTRLMYLFTRGHLDMADDISSDETLMDILRTLYSGYRGPGSMPQKNLFEMFHVLKEKDSECFFDAYKLYLPNLYHMLSTLLFKKAIDCSRCSVYELQDLAELINIHARKAISSRSYSKNDFFNILMAM